MNSLIVQLDQLIEEKHPKLASALLPGTSFEDLENKFGSISGRVPNLLKELWFWHDGQSQNYHGNFHSRTNEMLMSSQDALETMFELDDLVESGDIDDDNWQSNWLPFSENGGGNYTCVCLDSGDVHYYDKYKTSTGIRFSSFQEYLADLVDGYKKL